MRALARGESPDRIAAAIEAHRLDKPDPRKYAQRTLDKAQQEHSRRSVAR
ncbi:MAG: hypothetical protein JWN34_274 [Bryobacterales bacterium]|jgi:hypothetical protein|nr:hypothetical protein [Bryobacterales bacterium]